MAHVACSFECAIEHTKRQREKQVKQAKREERVKQREFRQALKTRSDWVKEAQAEVNRYIRLRDKGKPCISCGRPWKENFQASHYVPAGRSSKLRFDEDNIHGGCVKCNMYESGNLRGYRIGLVQKIGEARVLEMEADYEVKRWDVEDLKEIKYLYKNKAKELINEMQD